jgi:hypothetical protein
MLRKWAAIVASAAMLTSSTVAFADDQKPAQQQGALAPGNAAGVEKATGMDTNVLLIALGIGLVAGGVALALSSSGGGNGGVSSTGTN